MKKNKIVLANAKPTIKELDVLTRELIKLRDKCTCRRCGRKDNFQVAHIYSRSRRSVRFDEDNLVGLCANCHMNFAHKDPLGFALWVRDTLGPEVYSQLIMKANMVAKIDLQAVKLYLLQRIKELSKCG